MASIPQSSTLPGTEFRKIVVVFFYSAENICGTNLIILELLNRATLEELQKIGKTNFASKVKLFEEDGGGYMVSLDVFHVLHCLVRIHVVGVSILLMYM